ncbi:hypothetical protein FHQ08_10315 [Lactobacillus sp. CC-MHH1034]|uniref:hypothetical protein n=1 Tax=Agrilactobacillus fermenti TaxID=2586909 RepID=UPI001E2BDC32|nr:hypothetical protein [Agrilactobacillus fermenti]MCD2257117.1 hypothetical protein [Agrilactobacillus fermenti]
MKVETLAELELKQSFEKAQFIIDHMDNRQQSLLFELSTQAFLAERLMAITGKSFDVKIGKVSRNGKIIYILEI